jgi:ABC-2 type transport system ATP-binding protein
VDEVVDSMATSSQVRVRTPDAEKLLDALGGVAVQTGDDGVLRFSGVDAPTVGAAALSAGVVLHELVAERPDLERVFLELTQGKAEIR